MSAENDHPCTKCKRTVSSHQRLADAMIAATADTFDRDCVLYAFDTGVLAFKPYVKRCSIERPQESYGPLFAGTQRSRYRLILVAARVETALGSIGFASAKIDACTAFAGEVIVPVASTAKSRRFAPVVASLQE